jgi:uncharacterized protein (TIGR03437 family)
VQLEPANLPPGIGVHPGIVNVSASGLPAQQVAVTVTVSTAPALNARPSWLDLDGVIQTEAYIDVTATGSAQLPFTVTISPPAAWLTVTPGAGTTGDDNPPILHVTTNTAGLPAGTYSTVLRLSSLGGGASLDIPVRMQISGAAEEIPRLKISPPVLDLAGTVGGGNPAQNLAVQPSGPEAVQRFTAGASSVGGWLTVKPSSGTAPSLIAVSANLAALPGPGEYTGSIIVTSLITGDQDTIPVTMTLSVREVAADPVSLRFVQPQTGAPPSQTVSISAPSPTPVAITSASSWIRFSPDRASTPATLTVFADPVQRSPGTLNGSIEIVGPNNRLTIPVSLTIPEPEPPAVTPAGLTFSYELGNSRPPSQVLHIGAAAAPVTFTASASSESGVNWLSTSPGSGSAPGAITASVDPALLTPGTYTGNILLSFAGSSAVVTVPVTLSVTAPRLVMRELLHGATFAPTPVAPGQMVVLTGTGLGPVTEVAAQPSPGGVFGSQLAGVRLLLDGVPAPLLAVRNDRINAIVPYTLHGRTAARVQVEIQDQLSIPIEVKVVDSAPGIFTVGGLGRGQAAALNADLTPNSPLNPAPRGSVIAIYGTGEGQTDPPGQDGRILLTDLRHPLLPVTALIAGRPAEVIYAGSASTMVSGVFQTNIRIPEDIEPGAAAVQIRVGTADSPPGVTISVR